MRYLLNLLIALDQLANAVLFGWPDETISARAHRWHLNGRSWARNAINTLAFWQSDHCRGAYYDEKFRRQSPPELR